MDELNRCVECKHEGLQEARETVTRTVAGHTFQAELDVLTCPSCDMTYYHADTVGAFDLQVAAWLAEHGVGGSEAFQFMRRVLGIKGAELAGLLDITPETLSRWGKGHRPPDTKALSILGSMILDRAEGHDRTLQRLRSLQAPPPAASHVELILTPASA